MSWTLLAETPALKPPPGVSSNLVNPSSLRPVFIAAVTLELFLTSLAVGARVVIKILIHKSMQLEDCQGLYPVKFHACLR